MIRRIILCVCLLSIFMPGCLLAQAIGLPRIKNYSFTQYNANPNNYSVAQDNAGRIYVANTEGVLIFDGVYWRLIKLPQQATPTAIASGFNDRVYVGGQHFFGYFKTDSLGSLVFHSLSGAFLPEGYKPGKTTNIVATTGGVYFCTSQAIYHYNGNQLVTIKAQSSFHTLHLVNQHL